MRARNIAVKSILNIINHSFYKSDEEPLSKTKAHTHTLARIPSIYGCTRIRRVFTCFEFPSFRFVSLRFKDNRICSLFSLSHRFSLCISFNGNRWKRSGLFLLENVTAFYAYPFSSFCQRILLGIVYAPVFLLLFSFIFSLFALLISWNHVYNRCITLYNLFWVDFATGLRFAVKSMLTHTHTHDSHFPVIFKHPSFVRTISFHDSSICLFFTLYFPLYFSLPLASLHLFLSLPFEMKWN